MGYYAEILANARDYDEINKVYKEAKRIVDDLRRKYREISGRERDDGNFLYSIIEEKGMPTESGDKQKAKHAAGLLESVRRMSTAPRDWGNSKGETDMGYYADLIKQKQEKQNSIVKRGSFNRGTYTIDKTTGMFGRTIYIVHAHYEKGPSKDMTFGSDAFETLQDAQKYADRLNSKEEKDNADSAYIEASQKAERIINRMLQSRDKKEAKRFLEKIGWETRTLGEDPADYARAIRRAVRNYPEKSAEILSNEKEEGYYAKLAEEKAERNNDKTVSLYGKNYSFGSDRQKNQQEFKKAQDDFNREYFKVKEEMDELQKELKSKRFKLDQQWNTFYSQVKGFLGL